MVFKYDIVMYDFMKNNFLITLILIGVFSLAPFHNTLAAIDDGLVSFWGLNEASGTREDSFGSNDLLEVNGSVGSAVGKIDSAGQFADGESGFLAIPDNTSFDFGGGDFSISAWVYLDNLTGTQVFVSKYGSAKSGGGSGYAIYFEPLTDAFMFSTYTGGGITEAASLGLPSINTWYHIVGIHDSVLNTNTIIINDEYEDSVSSVTDQPDTGGPFSIGAFSNTAYVSNARVDSVGLWNRTLTSEEVAYLYNNGDGFEFGMDITNPDLDTLYPEDDEVDVAVDTDLTIIFDENVVFGSGNISIKKTSDDSLVEEIDIESEQVSGDGTDEILVELSTPLENGVSYYVQIDSTAFEDTSGNLFSGITDTTTWNFTTIAGEPEPVQEVSNGGISKKRSILNKIDRYIEKENYNDLEKYVLKNEERLLRYLEKKTRLPKTVLDILQRHQVKETVIQNTNVTENTKEIIVRDLEFGMKGDDVVSLQRILISQGYSIPLGPTGFFGPQTKAALSAYQKSNSISPAVGYFGPITRADMKSKNIQGIWW